MPTPDARREPPDLRMLLLGACAWAGALAGRWAGWWALLLPVAMVVGAALGRRGSGRVWRTGAAAALVLGAVTTVAALRHDQLAGSPVTRLAAERAVAGVTGTVASDPRRTEGRFGDVVLTRLEVREVTGRGTTYALSVPVLVMADDAWGDVALGSTVRVTGRLSPADGDDLAAVLGARGPPEVVAAPDLWWDGAAAVRASVRSAVAHRPADQRALVPALVDGDDAGLDPALADDFRTTGLTHLLAVSGTNLTLVVGFLLVLARWGGVRGRWLYAVGAAGIVGFVLLARTEPSVLRAAVMGTVALFAMGTNGRQRGTRALGVAVLALVLVEPGLAASVGFVLSVLATGGILLLAPGWRDALARWLPRWVAEAVAVPAAAQLACTPVVAAISGQVSLVAVAANLVVAPVVGPATVLGLGGGLVGLLWDPAGRVLGTPAAWCVAWIVTVAEHEAGLPTASLAWGTGAGALVLLTVVVVVVALGAPYLLRGPATGVGCCLLLVVGVLVRPPTPGWPPDGWLLAACDVGQGDALVLNAGPHAGVVVDAGPDPAAVDACLDRLEIRVVPLVVLTHFHADHVDGLSGVLDGRQVGAIETTRLLDPPQGVREVDTLAAAAGLAPAPTPYGVTRVVGDVSLQALWPPPDSPTAGPGDGSTANEASVVLLVEVHGVRMLLTGDVEPEGQEALAAALPGLQVDVLKVPHHGSRYQDEDWLVSLGARVALVSVGADNDYGHPAPEALAPLAATGARVLRTDLDGDLVVAERDGALSTETR
ncbi:MULTISPECIES: ComEC/Rec2 family competence protein [unclassified Nocardioides]|uniref:ComEC/Rec2 family competence protein n=1 Tax=unclassified Nocardioides TaxID=2615069 RepID=UPI0009EFAA01|nr:MULTISPECIES: ComEC/Rec2 family competence protein [unclassified Nocardioides]GAW49988.1 DNA internalization-related competence protein ComEC/Rec2 [Nocardioides sp. PD653-B2]GAW55919.1 DNA internalization-related competence protein ComEC/Rec2 [Nocardioides sp. PD653]